MNKQGSVGMDLDSARDLKRSLVSEVHDVLTMSPRTASSFGLGARRIESVEQTQRTLALGIHPTEKGDFRLAVRTQRRGFEDSSYVEDMRSKARDEVDVRHVGRIFKRNVDFFRAHHRPVLIGTSVGHIAVTAGTVGGFARTGQGESILLLSNNHVLADENRAQAGDGILQPGSFDGGTDQDRIGSLRSFVPLEQGAINFVDCALAGLEADVKMDPAELENVGMLAGATEDLPVDGLVEKLGRTTGHTRGRITAFELDNVIVSYEIGDLRFDDQIEVEGAEAEAFSQGGDSGSMIFRTDSRQAVALLFAGGDVGGTNGKGLTYANPLSTVLREMQAELIT